MAHTVYLGSFSKKLNSTARPNTSEWSAYSCVFKDGTSLYAPTITINTAWATLADANYNYARIGDRYYWIADIIAVRTNLTEIQLQLDPLATYKNAITGTRAFIEYGFNEINSGDATARFPDKRIAVNCNPEMHTETVDVTGGKISANEGCYLVQVVGDSGQNSADPHKGLAAFVLSAYSMSRLLRSVRSDLDDEILDILANVNALTPQDVANQLSGYAMRQELLNESAMNAIQSVRWLPLSISGASGTYTQIYLGKMPTGVYGTMLSQNTTYLYQSEIDIPWPVNDWRRNNCQMLLYLPFFGTIPIPVDQCINTDFLGVSWSAEYFSGSISVVINAGNIYTVYTGSTNISVDMGIGRAQVGISGMIGGGLQAVSGALQMAGGVLDVAAGTVGAALGFSSMASRLQNIPGGAANMYQGMAQMIQPVISCAGSMGGMAAIAQSKLTTLELLYYEPIGTGTFGVKYGHPVFCVDTPAAGFCKTRGFSVAMTGNAQAAAFINSAMDGGVYIE